MASCRVRGERPACARLPRVALNFRLGAPKWIGSPLRGASFAMRLSSTLGRRAVITNVSSDAEIARPLLNSGERMTIGLALC